VSGGPRGRGRPDLDLGVSSPPEGEVRDWPKEVDKRDRRPEPLRASDQTCRATLDVDEHCDFQAGLSDSGDDDQSARPLAKGAPLLLGHDDLHDSRRRQRNTEGLVRRLAVDLARALDPPDAWPRPSAGCATSGRREP